MHWVRISREHSIVVEFKEQTFFGHIKIFKKCLDIQATCNATIYCLMTSHSSLKSNNCTEIKVNSTLKHSKSQSLMKNNIVEKPLDSCRNCRNIQCTMTKTSQRFQTKKIKNKSPIAASVYWAEFFCLLILFKKCLLTSV